MRVPGSKGFGPVPARTAIWGWPARAVAAAAIATLLGLVGLGGAGAAEYDPGTVRVEVRVWQHVENGQNIHVSVRPEGGLWRTFGTRRLRLDDGFDPTDTFRYGDIALDVPLWNWASPVTVEVRVWQHVRNDRNVHISARGSRGLWASFETRSLPLDDGFDDTDTFRYGDIALDVPLPDVGVTTLAGVPGVQGYRDGEGSEALFERGGKAFGLGLEFDSDGSVVVADQANRAIRRIAADGTVTTIAGGNGRGVRDGPGSSAQFAGPTDVAIASDGSIYVADSDGHRIRKVAPDGMVTTVAGGGPLQAHTQGSVVDGPAASAKFSFPRALAIDEAGNLYIAEWNRRIRRLSPTGWVSTFAGTDAFGYRDGPAAQAQFFHPRAIDVDDAGKVYVLDESGEIGSGRFFAVRVIDPAGTVSTLFRSEGPGLGGELAYPRGLALGNDGTVYLANTFHHQILALTPEGVLRAVAGTGERGYIEGDPAEALFNEPASIAIADDGTLVVADEGNHIIRRIAPDADSGELAVVGGVAPPYLAGVGEVTILAGWGGRDPELADGPGHKAAFGEPRGMAFDGEGNVLVADSANHAIRSIAPDGTVTTLAGGNGAGTRDGSCASAQFWSPQAVAVAPGGDIVVADEGGRRIRLISPLCTVTTVVARGFTKAVGLAFDGEGRLLIVDRGAHRIKLLSPHGRVSTFEGRGQGHPFEYPEAIALDDEGNVFVVEKDGLFVIDAEGNVSALLERPLPGVGGILSAPDGIALGADGALYVTESYYGRVLRVTLDGKVSVVAGRPSPGTLRAAPAGGPPSTVRLYEPRGILVDSNGDLIVSDTVANVIWKITFGDEPAEDEPVADEPAQPVDDATWD